MTPLANLRPRLKGRNAAYQNLYFRCPACGETEVGIDIWNGNAGMVILKAGQAPTRLWRAEQEGGQGWGDLSISPSIDIGPHGNCQGWHGFITKGQVA